jgi:hypothetical protein
MRNTVACLFLLGAFVVVVGCGTKSNPIGVENQVFSLPPAPSSPTNALLLLEWSCEHLSVAEYQRLFTDDFRFTFSALDSAGNAYRATPWTREDELVSAMHLFVEGSPTPPPGLPRASGISLVLDNPLHVSPDPRPGRDPKWHKAITTNAKLNVRIGRLPAFYVTGAERFFFVRGDSGQVPAEAGGQADSTVWYVDAWEELTVPSAAIAGSESPMRRASPSAAQAVQTLTWGALKVLYR